MLVLADDTQLNLIPSGQFPNFKYNGKTPLMCQSQDDKCYPKFHKAGVTVEECAQSCADELSCPGFTYYNCPEAVCRFGLGVGESRCSLLMNNGTMPVYFVYDEIEPPCSGYHRGGMGIMS